MALRAHETLEVPPGGRAGEVLAEATSNPEREMREDLEDFAGLVEGAEINVGAWSGTSDRWPQRTDSCEAGR